MPFVAMIRLQRDLPFARVFFFFFLTKDAKKGIVCSGGWDKENGIYKLYFSL